MTKFTIKVNIPDALMSELDKVHFEKAKSREHAIKLIAVVLYTLYEEEVSPYSYYKQLSTSYIRDWVTTHNFYLNYFLKYLQGDEKKKTKENKIFQTNGIYCKGFLDLHYRINPDYLVGPEREYTVEIEFECLNEVFPDVLNHFNYSIGKIRPKYDRLVINKIINKKANEMGIIGTGSVTGFFNRNLDEFISFSNETVILPEKIKLNDGQLIELKELINEVDKLNNNTASNKQMIIQEKNKKNKDVITKTQMEDFIKEKQKRFLKRIHSNLDKILANDWMPIISKTNGRFNYRFTYLDKFCIDLFELDGEEICSLDLKNSQPTILANLIIKNEKLLKSIKSSKYEKLKALFDRTKDLFFNQEDDTWLSDFIETDIYRIIAKEKNISRQNAKKEVMKLFFTEPNVPSTVLDPLTEHFPVFIRGLKDVKSTFKKKLGSSKKMLPIFLQMVEAHIFIELIYEEIAKRKIPALTKHDCILFPKSREKEIKEIIDESFQKIGFNGKVVLEKKEVPRINVWPESYKPYTSPEF